MSNLTLRAKSPDAFPYYETDDGVFSMELDDTEWVLYTNVKRNVKRNRRIKLDSLWSRQLLAEKYDLGMVNFKGESIIGWTRCLLPC